MTTAADVLTGMSEARQSVPLVIRQLMSYFKVSATDVAKTFDVSRQNIYQRLNGTTVIKQEELRGFALFFGVPVEVLFLEPDQALRWVLEHRQEVEAARLRMTCFERWGDLAAAG